jgi:SAM-dependent methyltransferase
MILAFPDRGVKAGGYRADMLLDKGRRAAASQVAWPAARRHEHLAEVMALRRLLGRRRFASALYIGDGYGRFADVLDRRARQVAVAVPGPLARGDGSVDLAVLLTVLRRETDPADVLAEVARVLRPGGQAIIGAPNVLHGAAGRRYRRSVHAITQAPARTGVPARGGAEAGGRLGHHPELLMLQLGVCGLAVERLLSVSNLRHPAADRLLPGPVLLAAEYAAQVALAPAYYGPTLFFSARKRDLSAR